MEKEKKERCVENEIKNWRAGREEEKEEGRRKRKKELGNRERRGGEQVRRGALDWERVKGA